MSDLEKYIMENRDRLSADEPGIGHAGRFRDRLKAGRDSGQKPEQRVGRRLRFRHVMQIAASFAVIIASGVVIVKSNQGSGKTAAVELPEEYREAYEYYVSEASQRFDEISSFRFSEQEQQDLLLEELTEMDQYHQELLEELEAQPGDERVISALIHHYKLKLSVMDRIISQLNQIQKHNTEQNESTSI